jgi:hypothetical protein
MLHVFQDDVSYAKVSALRAKARNSWPWQRPHNPMALAVAKARS